MPDVLPADMLRQPGLLSMCAGDFVEVYKAPEHAGDFDCVATCFFIDTAHNILEYMDIIWHVLKVGRAATLDSWQVCPLCSLSSGVRTIWPPVALVAGALLPSNAGTDWSELSRIACERIRARAPCKDWCRVWYNDGHLAFLRRNVRLSAQSALMVPASLSMTPCSRHCSPSWVPDNAAVLSLDHPP